MVRRPASSLRDTCLRPQPPVAFHCLWALGFEPDVTELRRFAHSLLGCLFYGAFAAQVTLVRSDAATSGALPVVGGVVCTILLVGERAVRCRAAAGIISTELLTPQASACIRLSET